MNRPILKTHNAETGEIIEREYNDEEYAQYLIDKENMENSLAAKLQSESAKAALLVQLGITEEQAKLLLS
jgi:hypothetical protein